MKQVESFLKVVGGSKAAQWMINLFREVYLHREVAVNENQLSSRTSQKRALFAEIYGRSPKHSLAIVGATPSRSTHDEIEYVRIGRNSCIRHKWPKAGLVNSSFRTCTICGTIEYKRPAH